MRPVVKWAGGKRQLINKLIEHIPLEYNNYFEPFVGGGALLFYLMPKKAIINDINHDLMTIYKSLSNEHDFNLMIKELQIHEKNHCEEYYYKVRSLDRDNEYSIYPNWKKAARVIYLNKSCFNGLYRVNSKGYFNVPSAKKIRVKTYDFDNLLKIHEYFVNSKITILEEDFSKVVAKAKCGDFVYFDPPYDSYDNKITFTSYSKNDFGKEDQIRLANVYKELSKKGVYVMLSNHNTENINQLYKGFKINVVKAKRLINSNVNGRGFVEEVIITNY